MDSVWRQGINTLAKAFSCNAAEMTMFFQDYLYNPRQFDSVKDTYSDYPQFISVACQQLDARSLTDLLERIEAFPATECACKRPFC
jgi:hypothetical protein